MICCGNEMAITTREVAGHKIPVAYYCATCGKTPLDLLGARTFQSPRKMWQVGVEGDLFDAHDENEDCKTAGCVPVKRSPEEIEAGLAEAREVMAKGPGAVVEWLVTGSGKRAAQRAAAVRALRRNEVVGSGEPFDMDGFVSEPGPVDRAP